ncbi:hypothetical protein BGX33_012381 [Mortierella sp. NVP41]|nr:hypothetical protein BGX33_012381 [Mortierella sp. NVP41]
MALAAYLGERFAYLDSLKASFASSSSFSSKSKAMAKSMSKSSELSTPLALSNIIRTDGVHLQLLAFDTSKPWRSKKSAQFIQRIEGAFPDASAFLSKIGPFLEDLVVVGIDSGEIITAALCRKVDDDDHNLNLLITISALYSPTIAHQHWLDQLTPIRSVIATREDIDPLTWTKAGSLGYRIHDHPIEHQGNRVDSFTDGIRGLKRTSWSHVKSKRGEMDKAIASALKLCIISDYDGGGVNKDSAGTDKQSVGGDKDLAGHD